jgi:two-component system sensor histidine kinase VicK
MGFRFRVWMPLAAVFIVLLSIALMFLYGVPAVRTRLADYAQSLTIQQAATAAEVLSETADQQDFRRQLELSAKTTGGEIIIVDEQGRIVAREGSANHFEPSQEMLRRASAGSRMFDKVGELNVAVVPLITNGTLAGGVVLATDEPENVAYQLFLRSGLEAAALASVLGGGLMLLLAALVSRRVERLTLGAQAIEQGDFSSRIEPGFGDELGQLAKSFNAMAARLEDSFSQLEEKSSTLDAIVNNLTEGVLATDLKGNVVFANRSARAMLGIDGEGALGKVPDPWKDFDLPQAVARCAEQRECGEARVRDEGTFLRVKVEHLPAFDEHRGGVLVVMQDLSEGRRLEANQQRFLANAAHELKTPITTILGASELLLTGDEEDPELRRRFLEHIHSEARRMQRLSETLLRLARTGSDLREPELEALDLEDTVREAAERMRPLMEAANLTLHVEGGGGCVRADREWLEQVLLILLNNAVQHSGGDNVWLRAGGGTVMVEDDGAGIGEEDLPYVFERFYRGRSGPRGFGLGLPICKELVERMGGKISLYSRKGAGTTVEIALPEVDSG